MLYRLKTGRVDTENVEFRNIVGGHREETRTPLCVFVLSVLHNPTSIVNLLTLARSYSDKACPIVSQALQLSQRERAEVVRVELRASADGDKQIASAER